MIAFASLYYLCSLNEFIFMALISEAMCERSSMATHVSAFLCYVCVLVLAGMELPFFIVPGMGLFGICSGAGVGNIGML